MREFAEQFYKSKAWKDCAKAYKKSVGGLCEDCMAKGVVSAAEIVHHKTRITPENITDATVTLDWRNLKALCRECHANEHRKVKRRYSIDKFGRVTAR